MNTENSTEHKAKILQLQKSVEDAQEVLAHLKKEGYDLHSTAVIHARKIL